MKTVIRFSSLGLLATVCLFSSPTLDGADCNQNGIDDAMDLLPGDFNVLAAPRYRYPVGHVPGGVVAADFNGDGRPDLATADRGCAPCGPNRPSSVSVLLNRGDRTFEEAVSYPAVGAGGWVYELLVAADLDGDGSEDLATATGGVPGFVSVFLNRGDGTFDVAVSYLVGEGPRSLIAADFSGDGQLDLVTADKAHNGLDAISVLLNLGGGTFAEAVRYPVAGGVGPLVTADLDGDGSADLATVSMWCPQPEPPVVSVLRNRGEGVFEDAVSYPVAAGAELLITADLDGDGSPDLATALAAGGCFDDDPWAPSAVVVLLNRGDGTFREAVSYPVGDQSRDVVVGDFDGDGNVDLATGNAWSGDVSILINRGDGTFHDSVNYPADRWLASHAMGSLAIADFNGDEKLDLAAGGVSVLLNRGDGTFHDALTFNGAGGISVAADFDSDGSPDLATVGAGQSWGSGWVSLLFNRGDGSFRAGRSYPVEGQMQLIASDLDGDGRADLAAANAGCLECDTPIPPHVSVRLAREDGTFEEAVSYAVGEALSATDLGWGWGTPLVAADLDGDGSLDLGLATGRCGFSEGSVSVLLNRGDGTFLAPVRYTAGEELGVLIVADLNGDARPDLASLGLCSRDISVLINRGDGTFKDGVTYPAGGLGKRLLVVEDLNGDVRPDLVTASDDAVVVFLNRGDGTFLDPVRYNAGEEPGALIAADLNGDARPDLVTTGYWKGSVSVLLNRCDGTFEEAADYSVPHGGNPWLIASDLNGDGRFDLVCSDWLARVSSGGVVAILLNKGDGTFQDAVDYPGGGRAIVTDLDGDGSPDLANLGESELSVYINQGDGTFCEPVSFGAGGFPNSLIAADFNADGSPDLAAALTCAMLCPSPMPGDILIFSNETIPPFSLDVNRNGVPDECETRFLRGDSNADGKLNVADPVYTLLYNFRGGEAPTCLDTADSNDDGAIDIADAIFVLQYLFVSGPVIPQPNPRCGIDPTVDELGCSSFPPCEER